MSNELKFVVRPDNRDELWLFPYGVGKGVGYLIERATPNSYPRWKISATHGMTMVVPVPHKDIQLALLKLPRCKH